MKKKIDQVTIIGTGLIGASLGLALKKKKIANSIIGIDKSKVNLKNALQNHSIDEARTKIDSRIRKSEIIFLCTPVSLIDPITKKLIKFIRKNAIVSDVGSVKDCFQKETIQESMHNFHIVPGHPIAGTEHSGSKYAEEELFKNKWCIITPINNDKEPIKTISNIWKKIGMKISIMSVQEHDKIMSITSHLPHLIAFTIVGTAFNINVKKKKEMINFSAGGFRDFTRIGSSDSKMWTDIFIKNKKFILKTLDSFFDDINALKKYIIKNDYEKIFNLLKRTKEIRKKILIQEKIKRKN